MKHFLRKFLTKRHQLTLGVMATTLSILVSGSSLAYAPPDWALGDFTKPSPQAVSAPAPLGFQIFCMQNSLECKTSSVGETDYTFRFMRKLNAVNRNVNAAIVPKNDVGVDKWTLNASIGDCEDYVLSKRSLLVKAGIAAGALRIATATTSRGEGHAVLIVRTDRGEFVLDNRTNAIKLIDKTDLTYHAISGMNPKKWTKMV